MTKPAEEYSDNIRNLLYDLRYKTYPVIIIGSSSNLRLKNYGDIDMNSFIYDQTKNDVYQEMMKIINNIEDNKEYYFLEMKIQLTDDKKKYYTLDDARLGVKTELKHFKKIQFIKIDLITLDDDTFVECSVNYWLQRQDQSDIRNNILKNIDELLEEGKYFKVLKRKYLIYLIDNDVKQSRKLEKIFNSHLGNKYAIKSNLETIEKVLEKFDDEETINKVINNLKRLKIKPNIKTIQKKINDLDQKINNKAKLINENFNI